MPEHVLIVEDNTDTREMYAEFFRHMGLRVSEAADGHEGLAAVRALHPQAVVLDIMMPRMSGLDMAAQVRADRAFDDVALVCVSASHLVERALASGCDAGLRKPCEPDELLNQLKRAHAKRQEMMAVRAKGPG